MDFQAGAPGHLSDLGQRRSTMSGWEAEANSIISEDQINSTGEPLPLCT